MRRSYRRALRTVGVGRGVVATAAIAFALLPVAGADALAGRVAGGVGPGIVDVRAGLGYQRVTTIGTGMIVDGSGEVLTNNHVIRGATSIRVRDVDDGRIYSATVVGYDASADVAVLRLEGASRLTTVRIGNSSRAKVGDAITAIGNAGGVGGTPSRTTGKVVALDQSITALGEDGNPERLSGLIEMSAPTQPGDSGGPLVNGVGQVIGMNTAGTARFAAQESNDEGFAIPIKRALSLANQIENGHPSATIHIGPTAFLGVTTESPGYDPNFRVVGARVTGVLSGTPAARAGLIRGDIIYAVDGQTIVSPEALTNTLISRPPGATVQLGWIDQEGKTHRKSVRLASGPPQ
jgi:S1-C subfamily serine protease